MKARSPALSILFPFALFLAAFALLLPPDSFWCMDEANRFLQTHALTLGRATLPPELPYPGSELITDPALLERLRPLPGQYGFMRDGRLYSQYTPILAIIAMPFYSLLGTAGIYIAPLAGGLALALVLAGVLRSRGVSSRTSLLLASLATPIPFYSLTFFSHSMALFLTLASMLLLRRGRIIPAFIAAMIAVSMRVEMVFALPLLLHRTDRRGIGKMVVVSILSVALFLILQKVLTGSWLGTHLASSGTQSAIYGSSGTWLETRLTIVRRAFINAMPGFGTDGLVVGLVIWGLWGYSRLREGTRSGNAAVYAGLLLTLVPIAFIYARRLPKMSSAEKRSWVVDAFRTGVPSTMSGESSCGCSHEVVMTGPPPDSTSPVSSAPRIRFAARRDSDARVASAPTAMTERTSPFFMRGDNDRQRMKKNGIPCRNPQATASVCIGLMNTTIKAISKAVVPSSFLPGAASQSSGNATSGF